MFLNEEQELEGFLKIKRNYCRLLLYLREKRNILIDNFEKPLFGKNGHLILRIEKSILKKRHPLCKISSKE